ncbi:MAG: nitroreductase family protein [Bdellovibrionaceae bacterium]|nr:nitroreductase family protein [Pseudobdellovibrionaceae bacterium]
MTTNLFSPTDVQRFFDEHWTVRKYKAVSMPSEHLETILAAAQRAPTDATAQMYSFIRLTDPALRARIAEAATNAHIATASESFLICADVHRLKRILEVHGVEGGHFPHIAIHFGIGDAVMAAQNMLIASEMLGYRGCWIGGVLNALDLIAELTQLPEGVFPFAALTIGVPDEPPQHRPRLPREQVIHENHYRPYSEDELKASSKAMGPITARGDWPQTLSRYFGKGGGMEQREPVLESHLRRKVFLE